MIDMWLKKYLSEKEYKLLLSKYEENYIMSLDRDNFYIIYHILLNNGFYFINDIILKYLEIFTMDKMEVLDKILLLKIEYGKNYVKLIGENLNVLDIFLNNN